MKPKTEKNPKLVALMRDFAALVQKHDLKFASLNLDGPSHQIISVVDEKVWLYSTTEKWTTL